jgi:hypothetical protein
LTGFRRAQRSVPTQTYRLVFGVIPAKAGSGQTQCLPNTAIPAFAEMAVMRGNGFPPRR